MLRPNSAKSKEVATDENFLFGKQNLQKVRKNYKVVRKQNSKAEFRRKWEDFPRHFRNPGRI